MEKTSTMKLLSKTQINNQQEYEECLKEFHKFFCTKEGTPGGDYKMHLLRLLVRYENNEPPPIFYKFNFL